MKTGHAKFVALLLTSAMSGKWNPFYSDSKIDSATNTCAPGMGLRDQSNCSERREHLCSDSGHSQNQCDV